MSKSEENLRDAFAGESQANRKYLAFAKKADKEGYAQVAKLFRAAAAAETVHAHAHLRTLKGINSTADNLKEAIAGETHEFNAKSAGTPVKTMPRMNARFAEPKRKRFLKSIKMDEFVESKIHQNTKP
jgi:rubrerythrin